MNIQRQFLLSACSFLALTACASVKERSTEAISIWQSSPHFSRVDISKPKSVDRQKTLERADSFYSWVMPQKKSRYVTEGMATVFSHYSAELEAFLHICGHDSITHPIVATVSAGDADLTKSLFECLQSSTMPSNWKDFFASEILAKIVAYRSLQQGDLFPVPFEGKFLVYEVDYVFNMGSGIPAYGLISKEGPPLLIFRGSEFAFNARGRETLKANLDAEGPGYKMYLGIREELKRWLQKQNEKAHVFGFSLGGILSAYALILDPTFFAKGIAFNMPGISKKMLRMWNLLPIDERPQFQVYVNRGDGVSKVGLLFGEVFECILPRSQKPIRAHNALLLGNRTFEMRKINVDAENKSNRLFVR